MLNLPINGFYSLRKKSFKKRESLNNVFNIPSSKNSLRRFSSYEELSPATEETDGGQENRNGLPANAPPTKLIAKPSRSIHPLRQSFRNLTSRLSKNGDSSKSNLPFRSSSVRSAPRRQSDPCAELNAQLTRIREQLNEMRTKGIELSQRVGDLTCVVDAVCQGHHPPAAVGPSPVILRHRHSSSKSSSLSSSSSSNRRSWSVEPDRQSSGSSLASIVEELEEVDGADCEEESEASVNRHSVCSGLTPAPEVAARGEDMAEKQRISSSMEPPEQLDSSFKQYCIQNNLLTKPRAKSFSQLEIIRNDLSGSSSLRRKDSAASSRSDSVVYYDWRYSSRPASHLFTPSDAVLL